MKDYFLEIFRKNTKEINELYVIRAIGCFLVILFHCYTFSLHLIPKSYSAYMSKAENAEVLMSLFFVISAFLVSASFSKEVEKRQSYFENWKSFVFKRSLRIFPAFYFVFFLTIYFMSIMLQKTNGLELPADVAAKIDNIKYVISYWWSDALYISNFTKERVLAQGWSLSMEEQFYLLMPIFYYLYHNYISTRRSKYIVLIFLIIIPNILRLYPYYYVDLPSFGDYVNYAFHPIHLHFEPFVYGILLMELWRDGGYKVGNKTGDLVFYSIFIICSFVFYSVIQLTYAENRFYFIVFRNTFYAFYAFLIVYGSIFGYFKRFSFLLSNAVLVFIGKLSYGIYLIHMLVNTIVLAKIYDPFHPEKNDILIILKAAVISLIISTLFALLSYYFIEKPFLKIREWSQPRYDISKNQFYYTKTTRSELIFVSIVLTILSFAPFYMLKMLMSVGFFNKNGVNQVVMIILFIIPLVLNLYTLMRYKKIYFLNYFSKFNHTKLIHS
ncbi:acyltransferase family protein [Leptospira bouyouniensis]|uniref:Acyltransferase n=1 Tax=Leptospira bouyouniensis TaxID=2484911 RepID=A0ABY2L3N8_9LEPT|nr:acyltransferase [Leptospira bouyouniensis]TGK48542.1 acyltransferase [Leptospira bouyouniensis]